MHELCGWDLPIDHGRFNLQLMPDGCLLRSRRERLHQVQRGDVPGHGGVVDLHQLRSGDLPRIYGRCGVVELQQLFGGDLCGRWVERLH